MTKEYRIKISVRNNLLLSAIENAGYKSQSDFARICDIRINEISELVSMRNPPINQLGHFTPAAKVVMEVLGAAPSDLWTNQQLNAGCSKNTREFFADSDEVLRIGDGVGRFEVDPESFLYQKEMAALINKARNTLSDRSIKILNMRYGDDEVSQQELSNVFKITRARVGQLQMEALQRLRHPSISDEIKENLYD